MIINIEENITLDTSTGLFHQRYNNIDFINSELEFLKKAVETYKLDNITIHKQDHWIEVIGSHKDHEDVIKAFYDINTSKIYIKHDNNTYKLYKPYKGSFWVNKDMYKQFTILFTSLKDNESMLKTYRDEYIKKVTPLEEDKNRLYNKLKGLAYFIR